MKEGKRPSETERRQVKYLDNVVEADHGKLKRLIKPTLGFKSMKTACAAIKGFEAMRALGKKQAKAFQLQPGIGGRSASCRTRLRHRAGDDERADVTARSGA